MTDSSPFDLEALRRNETWLRPMLRSLVDDDAAGDVLQRTWLRAWLQPPQQPARLAAWLSRVATRFALSHRRAERVRAQHELAAAQPDTEPSTATTVERLGIQRAVSTAVSELAEPYRTAVLLRFYHGLSAEAVAERTGTTPANARQRVHRGLAAMRQRLGTELGEDWRRLPAVLAFLPAAPVCAPAPSALPLWLSMNKLRSALAVLCLGSIAAVVAIAWPDGAAPIGEPPAGHAVLASGSTGTSPPSDTTPLPSAAARHTVTTEPKAAATEDRVGTVLDYTGRPVEGVTVRVRADRSRNALELGRSDAAGHVRAPAPWPTGQLEAAAPWFAIAGPGPATEPDTRPPVLIVAPSRALDVEVVDEQGAAVDATARLTVHGLVDFPMSLDDAVVVGPPDGTRVAPGRVHWDELPVAATTLTVHRPGYLPQTLSVDAGTPMLVRVTLRTIRKGARLITGIVTNDRGALLVGAQVGIARWRTVTDNYGVYQLMLEAGASIDAELPLFAAHSGWCPAVLRSFGARLTGSETEIEQNLQLSQIALSIGGRVADADGKPLAGVAVYPWQVPGVTDKESAEDLAVARERAPLSLCGNPVRCYATTDPDGRFELTGLDRKGYRLRLYDKAAGWAWTTPELQAGTADVELRLPPDLFRTIDGIAVGRDGTPAAGLKVQPYVAVHDRDGGVASVEAAQTARTDDAGHFHFDRLPQDGVSLSFTGGDWIEQSLDLTTATDLEHLRVVMPRRCHFRVELSDAAFADGTIRFRDTAGEGVWIHEVRATTRMTTVTYRLHGGKSEVLGVADSAAAMLVQSADGKREATIPVVLRTDEVTVIRQ